MRVAGRTHARPRRSLPRGRGAGPPEAVRRARTLFGRMLCRYALLRLVERRAYAIRWGALSAELVTGAVQIRTEACRWTREWRIGFRVVASCAAPRGRSRHGVGRRRKERDEVLATRATVAPHFGLLRSRPWERRRGAASRQRLDARQQALCGARHQRRTSARTAFRTGANPPTPLGLKEEDVTLCSSISSAASRPVRS